MYTTRVTEGVFAAAERAFRAERTPIGIVDSGFGPLRGEATWMMPDVPVKIHSFNKT